MQVTHFGHSCVLLDTGAARLLIDPGSFSAGFEQVTGLDAILVTHQHPDHLDTERLSVLLAGNPDVRLIVDPGTAEQLGEMRHEQVQPGASVQIGGSKVDVLGGRHAVIHPEIPVIPNNAYLVDGTHLHPGDSLDTAPPAPVDVLFLPTAAPWQKLSDAVGYLRMVAPRVAVPIHQGILSAPGLYYGHFERLGPEQTTLLVPDLATPVTL
ncbi:MAG: beta-lactamase domain protein [Pseudonocardia sp.]|jgi:L-ascorbate metabolism protein UlaG (beta-lactamase superfamily)|nr:beta-lactamase domain protein [Pseudonocardia sp.]